jgi:hypothetical protein
LTRRLPEGFAERKTARVSRRWQAATLRLSASVQRVQGMAPDRHLPALPEPGLSATEGPEYNQGAIWPQVNPRKTKEKCLDFLGFLWRKRGFSTGYSEKNKKNFRRANSRLRLLKLYRRGEQSYFPVV